MRTARAVRRSLFNAHRSRRFTSHFKVRAPGAAKPQEPAIHSGSFSAYFLGNHFSQFFANSSTLSLVMGISSPFTKVEGGFLFSATLSYSMSTDLLPHS